MRSASKTEEQLIRELKALHRRVVELEKLETERKQAEELYRTLANDSPTSIYIAQEGEMVYVNPETQKVTGYSEDELLGSSPLMFIHPEDREQVRENSIAMLKGKRSVPFEFRVTSKDGKTKWYVWSVSSIQYGEKRAAIGAFIDVTAHKQGEAEREQLIAELQDTLAKVKTLSGLLPICAWCKKIRNEEGYWQAVEQYTNERSEADFTHGICSDCFKKAFPECGEGTLVEEHSNSSHVP